ncbi:iron transporter [Halobaculum sp. P14]|uniref:iron transporter n=1 Tax=Halobaculum sp. P14 TaxID=3421638 RepID=UPI003EB750E2
MKRRSFLRTGAATGLAGAAAGCLGFRLRETGGAGVPPVPSDRPDGVYVPGHVEGMKVVGTRTVGDYSVALLYSYAHRFWNVNGAAVERTSIGSDDDLHLMAVVWDAETGQVLPETGLSVEVTQDGDLVTQEVIYPMLSQPMGFHYGANFSLNGDGAYTATLSVGAVSTRRTGAFADRLDEPADIDVEFDYSAAAKEEIPFRTLERGGEPGAVDPMTHEALPDSRAPARDALPGTVVGAASSNDAVLVATVLESPPSGVDAGGDGAGEGSAYLAVSARTPYNRMLVPAMALEATLTRGGDEVFAGELTRTLDPSLSYHYGAVVDAAVADGDELTLTPTVWPQTARHEGYETAFGGLAGGMPPVTIPVSRDGSA